MNAWVWVYVQCFFTGIPGRIYWQFDYIEIIPDMFWSDEGRASLHGSVPCHNGWSLIGLQRVCH